MPTGALARDECLLIAAALEQGSEHPVGLALQAAAAGLTAAAGNALSEAGQGIEGEIAGRRYRIGRPDYALALAAGGLPDTASAWLESGDTVVVLGDASGCLGLFRLGDEVRPEARR